MSQARHNFSQTDNFILATMFKMVDSKVAQRVNLQTMSFSALLCFLATLLRTPQPSTVRKFCKEDKLVAQFAHY
jgi:hypothetical protein